MSTKILIVDGDPRMRELLKTVLRKEGFMVAGEARNGQAALTQADKLRPEVVCMEVDLPDMCGLEVLKIILEKMPQARVIVISADASVSKVRDAVGCGAAGYILKPFNQVRVGTAVRAALKDARA
ncbi:MAG TPA: response regulator [Thiobacillaceae bacterium]|nr:response regulator [Thiobacillaceae bacterium]HNU63302.1 response regulator [Thiobacillaceae bacterium]